MKRNHLYIGFYQWIDMEQLPDHPMYEKWQISFFQSVEKPLPRLLERNRYIISSISMMRLKPVSLGAIIISVPNVKTQRSS